MNRTTPEYGSIADGPFAPLYPFYAKLMISRTGISTGHLLDVGSNQGNLGIAAWKAGDFDQLTFLDVNGDALAKAQATAAQEGIDANTVTCSVDNIDLPDESVDLAISRGSMPFWDDQAASLKELFRVLKPNGCAYIGGGLGTREMREKIVEQMKRNNQGEPFYVHRRGSKSLNDAEYVAIFEELECSYAIINSCDEGHWLIFSKAPQR